MTEILAADALRRALSVRDLTDEAEGPHAMQQLVAALAAALRARWPAAELRVERQSPIVSVADNYDRLHYPPDGAARAARYTRYVSETQLLRTQTSAMIPPLLRQLAAAPSDDIVWLCPGLVYRRDSIDRLHTSEPQQLDVWRVARVPLGVDELQAWIAVTLQALLPGREYRSVPAHHPYTQNGLQLDVRDEDSWIEVGECGLASPALLQESGLAVPDYTALAMGLGLDRILMLRKGLDDVRLLRARDPRIAEQLCDLSPYRPVSSMPAVRRDLSVVVEGETDDESLGDAVRTALGANADVVESVQVIAETPYPQLPEAARDRLGIRAGQKNLLVRVVLRALDRTLTHHECNRLRDEIYQAVHRGSVWHWAAR